MEKNKQVSSHTPGEWEVWESSTQDIEGHHLYIAVPYKGKICKILDIAETHISKQDLANAELMASAPKLKLENEKLKADKAVLIEALRGLIVHLEWREDFVIEDAEEGNINCYTVATEAIKQINQ